MPVVKMPDGALVELPDNPTPEQLVKIRELTASPEERRIKESGRVADQVLRGGATAPAAMIGEAANYVSKRSQQLDQTTGAPYAFMGTPYGALIAGLTSLMGNPGKDTKFGDTTKAVQTLGGILPPVSKPETNEGKAIGNIGEAAVSSLVGGGPGSALSKLLIGGAAGAGGETSARLLGDNALTRLLGSIIGGGAAGAIQASRSNPEKLIRQATSEMTDADWQKAKQMEQVLNAYNIPHTKSQLLGDRSTLDDVVQTASANPSIRPKLADTPKRAAAASEHALSVWSKQNLNPSVSERRQVLDDIQEAAQHSLDNIRNSSNRAFEKAMPPTGMQYPEDRARQLHKALMDLADSPKYGQVPLEGDAIRKYAQRLITSSDWDTSGVHPVLLAKAQAAAKAAGKPFDPSTVPGAKQVDKFATGAHEINNLAKGLRRLVKDDPNYSQLPVTDVVNVIKRFTPEFDAARAAKADIMQNVHGPASKGLTGALAQMGGGVRPDRHTAKDTALGLVFDPTTPQPQAIRELAKTMGPDAVSDLLREHISKTMQRVLTTDDKSPRSFVKALYESPAQKENLDAALEVIAQSQGQNPAAVKAGFKRLTEALDSFQDLRIANNVSPSVTAIQASDNFWSKIIRPITTFGRASDQRATTGTYKEIAALVTDPKGLQKLQEIAKAKDPAVLQQVVMGILTSAQQGEQRD